MLPYCDNSDNTISAKTELLNKKLKYSLLNNDTREFRSILEKEGWPRYSEWSDYDLLLQAIRRERKKMVHLLLDVGARVIKKPNAVTALHLAATKQDWTDVVERLLQLKLRVADQSNYGRGHGNTALHYAFFDRLSNLDDTIDLLLTRHLQDRKSGQRVNVANNDNLSFFHIACTRPNLQIVKALFEADKDSIFLQESPLQRTALHFAVEYGRHQIAEYLLQNGAEVYKQDATKSTPLHLALKRRDAQMIDLLLAHDKHRKNIVNLYGLSHLMVACAGSKVEIVKQYLQTDKSPLNSINAQVHKAFGDLIGCTPLHFAADFGRADTVELLLDYEADCCASTFSGLTAHHFARKQLSVCQILQKHCDIVKKCRETRAQSPDFGRWGENYERDAVNERIRMLKYLDRSLKSLSSLRESFKCT